MKGRIEVDNMMWIVIGLVIILIAALLIIWGRNSGKTNVESTNCKKELTFYCTKTFVLGDSVDTQPMEDACGNQVPQNPTETQMKPICETIGIKEV